MSPGPNTNAIGIGIVALCGVLVLGGLARLSATVDHQELPPRPAAPPAPPSPPGKGPAPEAPDKRPLPASNLFQLAREIESRREWKSKTPVAPVTPVTPVAVKPVAPAPTGPDPFGNKLVLQAIIGADHSAQVIVNGTPVSEGETFQVAGKDVKLVAVLRGEARFQLGDVVVRRVLAPLTKKGSP